MPSPSYAGQSLQVVALRVRERGRGEFTIRATFAVNETLTAHHVSAAARELEPLLPDHEVDLVAVSLSGD